MAVHPYTIALLFLSRHPRIKGRLTQLQRHISNPHRDAESQDHWGSYTSSLMYDCSVAYFVCAHMLSVSTTILYYSPDEAATASVAAVTACMSAIGLVHVCCMRWHLQSVHQNPDASRHWCRTSTKHEDCAYKQTESLIAAPIAWILWTIASFVLLMGLVIQHFPVPICADDNTTGRRSHTSDVLNEYVACKTLEPSHYLPQSSRVVTIVILLVGTIHVSFNVFYFTMLGAPDSDALSEHQDPHTAPSSGSQEEGTPAYATREASPDSLPNVQKSSPPHEDLPSDSEVQDNVSSEKRRRPRPTRRTNELPSWNIHIEVFRRQA